MARPKLAEGEGREITFTVRVHERVLDRFSAAARLLGGNKSTLVNQYMVKVAREEEDRDPEMFSRTVRQMKEQRLRNSKESKKRRPGSTGPSR